MSAMLLGCDVNINGKAVTDADIASLGGAVPAAMPSAVPSPEPSPMNTKTLLSQWQRTDGRYSVDLSTQVNVATSGIEVNDGRLHFHILSGTPPIVINDCVTDLFIDGTESLGTLTITRANGGSVSVNNAYCNALKGTWEYAAMGDETLRLCQGSNCVIWQ